jgi:hypothetical protein
VEGVRYSYYVRAEGRQGQVSRPSNVVIVPSLAPTVTFDRVHSAIRDLVARHKVKSAAGEASLLRYLAAGRAAAQSGEPPRARRWLEALHRQVAQNRREVLDPLAAEELEIILDSLLRRISLAQSGVIPVSDLVEALH